MAILTAKKWTVAVRSKKPALRVIPHVSAEYSKMSSDESLALYCWFWAGRESHSPKPNGTTMLCNMLFQGVMAAAFVKTFEVVCSGKKPMDKPVFYG
jgi:hypothetical protein